MEVSNNYLGGSPIKIEIPGYRVVRAIGRGGMATVYLAIQESFQREVALKIMSPSLSEDTNFSDRFLREARIVSRLMHPNIVTVHDVGIANGHHYLSMEYIDGRDLKTCLPELTAPQHIRVIVDMANALDYAGSKGYVHRDVKPENIMIHNADGRAILMDFGIARAADAAKSMTQTGTALGTPHYMSPEQARGHAIDSRSDLYSLGVLLYWVLTGTVPFDAESAVAIGIKHVSAKIPPLPSGLEAYQEVIDKVLAKKPDQRYQTGAQLVAALERIGAASLAAYKASHPAPIENKTVDTPPRVSAVSTAAAKSNKADKPSSRKSASKPDKLSAGSDSPVTAPEALHIPREDVEARFKSKETGGRGLLLFALLLVIVAGVYFAHANQFITLPFNWLPPQVQLLLGIDEPSESDSNVVTAKASDDVSSASGDQLGEQVVSGERDEVSANDIVGTGKSDFSDSSNDSHINRLLDKISTAQSVVKDAPEKTPELLALYRQVLQLQPGHKQVSQEYQGIQQQSYESIQNLVDGGDFEQAASELEQTVRWFPELARDERTAMFSAMLDKSVAIATLLEQAEGFLLKDYLIGPASGNAYASYNKVLNMDPDNIDAQLGIERIIERYQALTKSAIAAGNDKRARSFIKNGLRVRSTDRVLLELKNQIDQRETLELQVKELLEQAQSLRQSQQWFNNENSAVASYMAILALDENHPEAISGLAEALDEFIADVDGLIAVKDYDSADEKIQRALTMMPASSRLQALAIKLQNSKPAIDGLQLSGRTIESSDEVSSNRFPADRTLYIGFNFRNLVGATTVFQARLYDGSRSRQIAAVPVVVTGENGYTQFRINRPVEGFSEGGYHIDILLAGERILTSSFVIDN